MPFVLNSEPKPRKHPNHRPHPRREKAEKKHALDFQQWMVAPASPNETKFRHSGWELKRGKVVKVFESLCMNQFKLDRFLQCGSECTVEYSESLQKWRTRANYCKNRHCEPCMRAKANRLAANLRARLGEETTGRYRFITLTLKHSDTPLREQITRLYSCFRKLRNSKLWKRSQRGGATILEVKWKPDTKRWHPHLHIVSEGEFLQQKNLADAWLAATGDSFMVDIRALKSGRDAAHYVAKYVSKGTNADVWNDIDVAQQWVTASAGVRTCATFGKWRGFKLLEVTIDATDWKKVCSFNELVRNAAAGCLHSANLLIILRRPDTNNPNESRRDGS